MNKNKEYVIKMLGGGFRKSHLMIKEVCAKKFRNPTKKELKYLKNSNQIIDLHNYINADYYIIDLDLGDKVSNLVIKNKETIKGEKTKSDFD